MSEVVDNTREIPADVVAVMREVLAEAMVIARRTIPPGDGMLQFIGKDRILGKGPYDGGWKLQATIFHDTRMEPGGPSVHVHAYSDSTLTKGWLSQLIERGPEDEMVVARKTLARLREQRERLDGEILVLQMQVDRLRKQIEDK